MSSTPTLMDRVDSALARFTERERVLLGVMAAVLSLLIVVAVSYLLHAKLAGLDEAITESRNALSLLASQADDYTENAAYNDRLREQLATNEVRLSTFIEGRAGRANIPRPREFRDNQQVLDGGITMFTTTAEFGAVEVEQMERLLTSVEQADELVFTRQIAVTPARRGAEGVDLEVTLATYKQGGQP